MKSDEEIVERTKKKFRKNKEVELNKIYVVNENYFGTEYKAIHAPLKKEKRNTPEKPLAYVDLYDPAEDKYHNNRRGFLYKKLNARLISTFLIPYTAIYIIIALGYLWSFFFLALSFLLPIIFGYIFFKLCYEEMKDYLKKIADLIVITSGVTTATLTIMPFLPFKKIMATEQYSKLADFYINHPFIDDIKSIITLLSIEFFIGFYTIKFLIALSEVLVAKIDYHNRELDNPLPEKKSFLIKYLGSSTVTFFIKYKKKCRELLFWRK